MLYARSDPIAGVTLLILTSKETNSAPSTRTVESSTFELRCIASVEYGPEVKARGFLPTRTVRDLPLRFDLVLIPAES